MKTIVVAVSAFLLASSLVYASDYESTNETSLNVCGFDSGEVLEGMTDILSSQSEEFAISTVENVLEINTNDAHAFLEWILSTKQEVHYEWNSWAHEAICQYRGKVELGTNDFMDARRGALEAILLVSSSSKADQYAQILQESEKELGNKALKRLHMWVSQQLNNQSCPSGIRSRGNQESQPVRAATDSDAQAADREAMIEKSLLHENFTKALESACDEYERLLASYSTEH